MNTFKRMAGFLMALLCLTAVISIIWYCLFGQRDPSEPGGTLVKAEDVLREGESCLLSGRMESLPPERKPVFLTDRVREMSSLEPVRVWMDTWWGQPESEWARQEVDGG